MITAEEAINMLVEGNRRYVNGRTASLDASEVVLKESVHGQKPYATVITCSDSRVIPEAIFSAGIGALFVIRVAGNVIGENQLGSIEYAAEHLGTKLVVVLGHNHCGAVDAALHRENGRHIHSITDVILEAIGNETDASKACCLNVANSCRVIENSLEIPGLNVHGAIYHLESGEVEFL